MWPKEQHFHASESTFSGQDRDANFKYYHVLLTAMNAAVFSAVSPGSASLGAVTARCPTTKFCMASWLRPVP